MSKTIKDLIGPQADFHGIYRGVVVDTLDPQGQGRVRVKVFDFMNDIGPSDYDLLPWAVPAMPLSSGAFGPASNGNPNFSGGSFYVPLLESHVFVFFEAGDFNQPVYFAEATDPLRGQPYFKTQHYPATRGMLTRSKVRIMIDDEVGTGELARDLDNLVKLHENGDVEVWAFKDVIIHARGKTFVASPEVYINLGENQIDSPVQSIDGDG